MGTVLTATGGRIAEFVNPKYVDAKKVCWCLGGDSALSCLPAMLACHDTLLACDGDSFAAQCTRAHWP